MSSMDRWICSRLYSTVFQVEKAFEAYELHVVTSALHSFWLQSLCDVYLECIKPLLTQHGGRSHREDTMKARQAVVSVLYHCVSLSLALLSPFMPFITEELWQRLQPFGVGASAPSSLCLQTYPRSEQLAHWFFPEEERDFMLAQDVIAKARSLRTQCGLTKQKPDMWVVCSPAQADILLRFESAVQTLSQLSSLHIYCPDSAEGPLTVSSTPPPAGSLVSVVDHTCQIHLHVQSGGNVDKQMQQLSLRRDKLVLKLETMLKRVQSDDYQTKVPAHVRQSMDAKVSALQQELKTLDEQIIVLQDTQRNNNTS